MWKSLAKKEKLFQLPLWFLLPFKVYFCGCYTNYCYNVDEGGGWKFIGFVRSEELEFKFAKTSENSDWNF